MKRKKYRAHINEALRDATSRPAYFAYETVLREIDPREPVRNGGALLLQVGGSDAEYLRVRRVLKFVASLGKQEGFEQATPWYYFHNASGLPDGADYLYVNGIDELVMSSPRRLSVLDTIPRSPYQIQRTDAVIVLLHTFEGREGDIGRVLFQIAHGTGAIIFVSQIGLAVDEGALDQFLDEQCDYVPVDRDMLRGLYRSTSREF